MRKAVFIDKDGTLIRDVPYNVDPDLIVLNEYVGEALNLLKKENYKFIVISNQSGVARGFFKEDDLKKVNDTIQTLLLPYNVEVDAFYYCPHLISGIVKMYSIDCDCRKPKPGLILQAAKDHEIDITASWMIGDILNDVEAGNVAGCRTILLDNGNETEWMLNELRSPAFKVKDLEAAAQVILKEQKLNPRQHVQSLA